MPRPAAPTSGERPPAAGDRIAKLLARAGIASRREVERMIAEGRIARDGVAIDTAATVLPSLAGITVDGKPVAAPEAARLFLYHKPVGLLVTERDPRGRPTIYDRLPPELPRVVPVGRLDLNTEGLLLLTTDGGLKRQLELPATGVERTYRARAYGQVSQAQLEALIEGVEVEGVRYGAIDANLERRTGANVWIELTLTEGKNREVRRVLEYLGLRVGRLIRTRYGPFMLGDLPPGAVGEARAADLEGFRRTLKGGKTSGPERVDPARLPSAALKPPLARAGGVGGGRPARHRSPEPKREPAPSPQVRADKAPHRADAAAGRADPKPARGLASRAAPPAAEGRGSDRPDTSPRPPRPERKPGWARAKPKAGPRRPKPRA